MSDHRQQQEAEEARKREELTLLAHVDGAGLHDVADDLARSLGLHREFTQDKLPTNDQQPDLFAKETP